MKLSEHFQTFKRAAGYTFVVNKKYTVLMILNAFLTAIIGYVPIYFSAKVIDALVDRAPIETVIMYVVLTVGIVFAVNLLNTYIVSEKEVANNNVWRNENWLFSEKATQLAYESIENPKVTQLRYRVRMESQTGQNLFYLYTHLELFIGQLTKIVASLALTISFFTIDSLSVSIKMLIVLGLLVSLAIQTYATKKTNELNRDFMAASVDMNVISGHFYDYIAQYAAGKDIRLYNMGDFLGNAYMENDRKYWEGSLINSYKKSAWMLPITVLSNVFKFGIYGVLIYAALQGGITIGSIAKYVTCLMLLSETLTQAARTLQMAFDNNHYLARYFSYFDIPNNMYQGSLTVEKRDDNEYFVEFRNVSFKYPNTDVYALKNVNLKFKVGEKLAIVGMNGSGKTTFIKLLCRLYDPTEGEILLNGVNIQKYDYDEYMSVFSVVFQDFTLFSFKLGEVVASSKQFDPVRVAECLRKANFGDRLITLPEGVDTYLYKAYDQSGIEISGGEAQKIALARALYKDSPFILLDEPTAALDPVSEYEVYSNFNAIAGEKTTVYISHRLASCRFCDQILVFDQGSIVQKGSHEQLLADRGGKYLELWQAQAQYYTK
ncbi:MAG: ABC transporter ATP-binding protein [Firmicutes bacterium]|nr:ABC transporter ATP-binding protein [Bacillota bacterium]